MDGKIITTVILQNPDGVWQNEQEVQNLPHPQEQGIMRRVLLGALQQLRMEGVTDFRGEFELDNIPMNRVKNINVRFEEKHIQTGTLADLAALGGGKAPLKLPGRG